MSLFRKGVVPAMLTDRQVNRMLNKLRQFEKTLDPLLFDKVAEIKDFRAFETAESLYRIPADRNFKKIADGAHWGARGHYCWFKASFRVPKALDGKMLFLRPQIGGYESLLWVNGEPFGTYSTKISFSGHGNHYSDLLVKKAKAGETVNICLEYYAGHYCIGTAPFDDDPERSYDYTFHGADVCVKNKEINDFYFDLRILNQLANDLPPESPRRCEIVNALYNVFNTVYLAPADTDRATFVAALRKAHPYMKEALAKKNGDVACYAGIIGHSHMDTAWLWHVDETVKKCARTYSNQIALMQEYPEYKFVQSSSLHSAFIREKYPELFERIRDMVAKGRYEPNGGVWVECDCNITSGESMVRQFLWGQRFTRKYFNYTSDCFWLPDTFGYSAAIPQIMKGCGVKYFLTTKIDWNDTNRFPYQTFWWEGLDGTRVLSHFNKTHNWPDPDTLIDDVESKDGLLEKSVSPKRLISFGYGDGGGGPMFEMVESARRIKDTQGCPRSGYTTVSNFMKDLEKTMVNPSVYKGELYLELHRGTLTNQHQIKRNNRKCEFALRDAEIFTVDSAVKAKKAADSARIHPLYRTLLQNQFHDILPGTCIPRAHEESRAETFGVLKEAAKLTKELTVGTGRDKITVTNTLSFDRSDPLCLPVKKGRMLDCDCDQQRYTDLDGNECLLVSGVTIPAFSSVTFKLKAGEPAGKPKVTVTDTGLRTPFATVRFDKAGRMTSFKDKESGRELCGEGYPLNTFLVAEDIPSAWDNWDVDADIEGKFRDCAKLLSRKVVSVGPVAAVIRSEYRLTPKSTLKQDVFFFSATKEVRFDTLMDWNDDHRFLRAAFDTSIVNDFVRSEIQYGCVKRPTTRNNSLEKAKFETVNHKYTDLSETRFGVALLNDSKYGVSCEGGSLRLSLHKGGCHPDHTGDHGKHRTVYSFLPHTGDFSAETVTRPAYELNVPCVISNGAYALTPLVIPGESNIIVEAVKPCEDTQCAFIVRLYECEGTSTACAVKFFDGAKKAEVTNMLEETLQPIHLNGPVLRFHPFEIKTLKIYY